jgi:hypothetical protein
MLARSDAPHCPPMTKKIAGRLTTAHVERHFSAFLMVLVRAGNIVALTSSAV